MIDIHKLDELTIVLSDIRQCATSIETLKKDSEDSLYLSANTGPVKSVIEIHDKDRKLRKRMLKAQIKKLEDLKRKSALMFAAI